MTTKKTLLLIVLGCVLLAAGIYAFAYATSKDMRYGTVATTTPASSKVAASTIEDGTYVAQIRSITSSSEDTTVTFVHVTYFEGKAASASAAHDVECRDTPLEACVPTLTREYYVRKSGAPEFTAPVTAQTIINLQEEDGVSVKKLSVLERQFEPVYEVVIADRNIVSITEKSPL